MQGTRTGCQGTRTWHTHIFNSVFDPCPHRFINEALNQNNTFHMLCASIETPTSRNKVAIWKLFFHPALKEWFEGKILIHSIAQPCNSLYDDRWHPQTSPTLQIITTLTTIKQKIRMVNSNQHMYLPVHIIENPCTPMIPKVDFKKKRKQLLTTLSFSSSIFGALYPLSSELDCWLLKFVLFGDCAMLLMALI